VVVVAEVALLTRLVVLVVLVVVLVHHQVLLELELLVKEVMVVHLPLKQAVAVVVQTLLVLTLVQILVVTVEQA
jgi:hypothetical protein